MIGAVLALLLAGDPLATRAPNAPAPLATPLPAEGPELVHPSVVHREGGWNGHAYWMAVTPYDRSEAENENPCLYVSEDGLAWKVPEGVANPLVKRPRESRRYNSDPCLAFAPDGSLLLFYRVAGGGGNDTLFLTSSRDGRAWTRPVKILDVPLEDERQLSPAVTFDGARWSMYYVDASAYPYAVRRRTAPQPQGPWSAPEAVRGLEAPRDRMLWHLDAFRDGEATVLLVDATAVYRTQEGGELFFAVSRDGLAFHRAEAPVLAGGGGWDRSIYRSCCLPETREGRRFYAIWYSAFGPSGWRLGYTEAR